MNLWFTEVDLKWTHFISNSPLLLAFYVNQWTITAHHYGLKPILHSDSILHWPCLPPSPPLFVFLSSSPIPILSFLHSRDFGTGQHVALTCVPDAPELRRASYLSCSLRADGSEACWPGPLWETLGCCLCDFSCCCLSIGHQMTFSRYQWCTLRVWLFLVAQLLVAQLE